MSETSFEKTLKFTNYCLILSGIKVSKSPGNKLKNVFNNQYLFHINFVLLYAVIFGEIYWVVHGVVTGKPFLELCLTSPCITMSILGTIKSLYLYLNRDTLVKVVDKLKEIHPTRDNDVKEVHPTHDNDVTDKTPRIEKKIEEEAMSLLKFILLMLTCICTMVFTTFCFVPLILMGYNYFYNEEMVIKYPYLVFYHYDVYNTDWWYLIYFHQVWATIIVAANLYSTDTLFYGLCMYIVMHFRLLGRRFENLKTESREECKEELRKAVVRHQELIDLVNKMEILYSKSSLFNIVTSSFIICLSAFNISVVHELSTMFAFITFLLMSLWQIALICYFADQMMRSSTELSGSIYECSWYNADEPTKKTILLIIVRSQKACKLTAWKFADLNLNAFTTILSRSWSYFALLKTVYK